MEINDNIILDYLDGLLTEDQRTALEVAVSSDPELQQRVSDFREMQRYTRQQEAKNQAINNLREVHRAMRQRQSASSADEVEVVKGNGLRNALKFLVLALGIIAFFFLGYKLLSEGVGTIQDPEDPELLFADNFDPSDVSFTSRGAVEDSLLEQAATDFNNGDYAKVVTGLTTYNANNTPNPRANYALAIAMIAEGQHASARTILTDLRTNPLYKDDVQWYIGLSYLRERNFFEARQSLAGVGKTSNRYKAAQVMLDHLGE